MSFFVPRLAAAALLVGCNSVLGIGNDYHRVSASGGDAGAGPKGGQSNAGGSSGRGGSAGSKTGGSSGQAGSALGGGPSGGGGDSASTGGEPPTDSCEPNPCAHGTCEANGASYSCMCDKGYRGDDCEINIDDCLGNPCTNGTCIDGVDAFSCDCGDTGYTGKLCETLIQNCAQTPCANGGACTDVGASRTCDCSGTGTTGMSCEVDIDECQNHPCDSLTTCMNSLGSFSCGSCPAGYSGTGLAGCDDIDECRTNNGGCDALTTCNNTPGSRTCGACPNGYSGTGATGCTNIDDCASKPCKNGGTCQDAVAGFTCQCQNPWSGSTCQNATLTINVSARGFYTDTDWFTPTTGNTITGWSGDFNYASYMIFPIPSFSGTVSSVTLMLEHELYDSPDTSEIVQVSDVSTSSATLKTNTAANQSIYQDLTTGTKYGSLNGWTAATVGTVRSITMSGAVSAVSGARGADFAVGMSLSSLSKAGYPETVAFSQNTETRVNQLQVVVTP